MVCEMMSDDESDHMVRVRSMSSFCAGPRSVKVLLPGKGFVRFHDLGHWCFCVEMASSIARPKCPRLFVRVSIPCLFCILSSPELFTHSTGFLRLRTRPRRAHSKSSIW